MADFSIEIKGLDEALKKLDGIMADATLRPPMNDAVADVQKEVKRYPPQYGGSPPFEGFKTDKQRRWFFWALREGKIQVPYKRGKAAGLGGSWATEVQGFAGNITGVVGTNMPYAKYVQNELDQYYLHKGRWTTVQDVANNQGLRAKIVKRFQSAIDRVLSR